MMHKSSHSLGGSSNSNCEIMIEKRLSKMTQNWEEMWLVAGLSISGTDDAYFSPKPGKTLQQDLGFHCGNFFLS